MGVKTEMSFNELDLKLLNELPLISEVITSTSNRLVRLFTPIYLNIFQTCTKNIPKGWEIDKKEIENILYPFSSVDGRTKINLLENFFWLKSLISLFLKDDKRWANYVQIDFGFYYDEEDEANNNPYFYFRISKDITLRYGGKLYPLSYYENIQTKYKELNFIIDHPEKGGDSETIELQIDISSVNKIIPASEIFAFEILPVYLKGIGK